MGSRYGVFKRFTCSVLVVALVAFGGGVVFADTYPTKPIKMIVPYPAGGQTDVLGRMTAQMLSDELGKPVVVENRPGASGMLGSQAVSNSTADGYTLLFSGSGAFCFGPLMAKKPLYDPIRNFTALSLVSYSPMMIVVNPNHVKVKSVKELIALAKEKPGKLNYGSFGTGSGAHLAGELLKTMANVDITHVPYKGDAPALVAMLGGEIDFMFAPIITGLPHVKSGRLNAIAVSKGTKSSMMPDLPTVAETLPDFEAVSWIGLWGPAGMPKDVEKRLSDFMVRKFKNPEVFSKFQSAGVEPVGSDGAGFEALIKKELTRWEPVIKAAGLLHTQ